jgi:predicted nucleotide-binding protein
MPKEPNPNQPLELRLPRALAEEKIDAQLAEGTAICNRQILAEQQLADAKAAYYTWSEYNELMLRQMFSREDFAEEYAAGPGAWVIRDLNFAEKVTEFRDDVLRDLRKLQSVRRRLELLPLAQELQLPDKPVRAVVQDGDKVFLVHGRDEALLEKVARFLEKIHLKPIILHEQPNGGRTLIEKFERYADVGFAVVLITPDDVGGLKADPPELQLRARQNVILELGFFLGRLGRERVCPLYVKGTELPSDYDGVVYVEVDAAGTWRVQLAKELREANFRVDLNLAL